MTTRVDFIRILGVFFIWHPDSSVDKWDIMLLVLVQPVDKGSVLCLTKQSVSHLDPQKELTGNSLPQ